MKNNLINFKCIRIQSELDRYHKTKTIPHDLLEGAFDVSDIKECLPSLPKKYQNIANKLIKTYSTSIEKNLAECKLSLRKDYTATMDTLATLHSDFAFPTIIAHYRADINPVTALYYEAREMIRKFNYTSEKHQWLYGLLTDEEFNNKLLDALIKDMKRLERIIIRYYWPLSKLDDQIPLELFHARQLTKDFKHYYTFFTTIKIWDPEH